MNFGIIEVVVFGYIDVLGVVEWSWGMVYIICVYIFGVIKLGNVFIRVYYRCLI